MRTFAFAVALLLANAEAQSNRGTYNSQNTDFNMWIKCKEETGTTCDDKYDNAQAYNFCYALNDNCNKKPTKAGGYWHDCYWYNVGCEEAPAMETTMWEGEDKKHDSSDDEHKDHKKHDSSDDEWDWDMDDQKAHSGAATLAATIVALGAASLAL